MHMVYRNVPRQDIQTHKIKNEGLKTFSEIVQLIYTIVGHFTAFSNIFRSTKSSEMKFREFIGNGQQEASIFPGLFLC